MTLDASVLPSELVTTAQPLVGLSGLDVQRNATHKTIWDAFNNSKKPESESIQYKLLPSNYEFPVSKPKRQSYEWYHPKGILKRNWMLKHLHVLPAVVVLFQDLEWNDPQWSEKQRDCASVIQSLKNSLQGRHTRLAVVLLQKGAALPQGEDLLASERAAHLTNNCDINAKMLFVLTHNDHLMGQILRLQSAFLELSQSCYTQIMKQIRSHKDQLTETHKMLKIRHLFKLGFISELKLDQQNALKHYRQTYANLDELRIVDTNCLEIKTVAGFVNYKICRLYFKVNAPKDAISHFKNHINKYRSRTGFKELLFEHNAWLSVQYSAFGELFCDAVKNGLAPLQTQHPGIYFHKAAEYIGKRKEAFLQCAALGPTAAAIPGNEGQPGASGQSSTANPNSALYSDFFGIRGTKTGEPVSEQQIICLVQEMERSYNHSAAIIVLLGQAMAQYKVYKCLRFRKKLAIDMAEEYLKSGDHSKALTLYSLMLSDYRVDKWYTIFTEVLLKTLRSAYLSASVPHFVECSIETLSPRIAMDKAERILILENLWKVFHNVSPVSSSQIAPELSASWQTALASFSSPIKLDLDRLNDLLECKITFDQRQIKNDEKLCLQLYIRSIVEVPLKLKNFSVLLTDLKSSSVRVPAIQYCEYAPTGEPSSEENTLKSIEEFILEPHKCYRIVFVGERYQFMENVDVHIFRLEVQMGSERTYAVLSLREKLNVQRVFKNYNPHRDCMEQIAVISSCYIIPTFHLGSQTKQNNQPMLTNEFCRITTNILNNSDLCLQNVGVSISVPQNLRSNVFLTTDLTSPLQKINSQVQIDIGELQMQSSSSVSYFVTSLIEGNIELRQRLYYQTENLHQTKTAPLATHSVTDSPSTPNSEKEDLAKLLASDRTGQKYTSSHNVKIEYLNEEQVRKIKEDTIVVPCVEEIKLSGRFYTLSRQPLARAYKNEDFILRVNMEVKAPDGVDVLETQFISDHNIIEKPYKGQQRIAGTKLRQGTRFEDLRLLNSINCSRDWVMQSDYLNNDVHLTFSRSRTPDQGALQAPSATAAANRQPPDDQFNRSLLAKLPTNATIIGSTNANLTNQLNLPLTNSSQSLNAATSGSSPVPPATGGVMTSSTGSADDFKVKPLTTGSGPGGDQQQKDDLIKNLAQVKNIYNHTIDCVQLTNNERNGFINAALCTQSATPLVTAPAKARSVEPSGTEPAGGVKEKMLIFGVYCIRWCRSSTPSLINESKFVINGIEVIDPPLNIYCYLEEKMYVRVPMTLRVTLKNPTRKIVHLQALLNSSDSFMFSGHRQLNVTIFAFSSYDLLYNLYPLKAGWQPLPELQLDYVNHGKVGTTAMANNSGGAQQSGKRTPVPGTGSMGASMNTSGGDTTGNTQLLQARSEGEDASGESLEAQLKAELDSLVKRWMPKMVFIHPPTRK